MPPPTADLAVPFEDHDPQIAPFPIVGVGASAGGLDAFKELLQNMPADTGMAFVLIQHLDPIHRSELPSLLSTSTNMPVQQVTNGMRVEANQVYVIAPNSMLQFSEQSFELIPRGSDVASHLTVDHFFRALAQHQARLSIGVVLSGTGADGSEGLKAIKSACGITFAQDEQSAAYSSMPRNAAATGIVDFVLSPKEIAAELTRLSRNEFIVVSPGQDEKEVLPEGDRELTEIFLLLLRTTGVDFSHYKTATMRRRIGRRLVVHRFTELSSYLVYLRQHPEEVQELFRDVLINVTAFFRDPDAFTAICKQLSQRVNSDKDRRASFRAWVPGCSTGEEVYSLAICLHELCEKVGAGFDIQFFATDISERALATARAGVYPARITAEISPERLRRYFTEKDGQYQISKTIRDMCLFARHDVTRDTPFSRLDLISCRNVLIYLDSVLQKGVLPAFHYGLNLKGLLFLGSAEGITSSASDLFAAINEKYRIFSRKAGSVKLDRFASWRNNVADTFTQAQVASAATTHRLGTRIEKIIRERYAPDAVVIDGEWQIHQFQGHTGFYLEPASGEATYNLLRMARGELPYLLREMVSAAIEQNAVVERKGIRVESGNQVRTISVEVVPLDGDTGQERFYMVAFRREASAAEPNNQPAVAAESNDERVRRLEKELWSTRAFQRGMSEEHDAAMEEARALNEELRSANEELQSSNEELETAKEELQSANEELTTVNEELDTRNRQLGTLNDDLNNLFAAVTSPVLRVDRELRIRRFTPTAEKLGVGPSDLNHPVRFIQPQLGNLPDIELLVRQVIDQLTFSTHDFQDRESRWWSLSIRPYRSADHRIEGAVLTFTDTDTIQNALHASDKARRYADAIIETVREPLLILTPELKVDRANACFYEFFRVARRQVEGKLLFDLGNGQWRIPKLESQLKEVLPSHLTFSNFEVSHTFPEIGRRVMLLNARQLSREPNETAAILLAFEDITERRAREEAAKQELTETASQLGRTKGELRALASNLMDAREQENRRMARELHDDFGQRLAVLAITLDQLRLSGAAEHYPPQVRDTLATVHQRISELTADIRDLSHRMHPAILEDLGLTAALKSLAEEFGAVRRAGVDFTSEDVPASIPMQYASAIYRITQQALDNATKYAFDAPVKISLTAKVNSLRLVISDRGPGFDVTAIRGRGGLGLINMQERAHAAGGELTIHSSPVTGTEIAVEIPLPDEAAA
ncbi:MAG: PAS domain-containing protein [Acidobacteriaceae bacterium]|nr:PAS domain-containing protein [Acidobacteriaceae bacterium]